MDSITNQLGLVAIGIFLLKETFSWFKDSAKEHDKLLQQNTMAIQRLTIKLEYLEKKLEVVTTLEKDLSALGQKIRGLSK